MIQNINQFIEVVFKSKSFDANKYSELTKAIGIPLVKYNTNDKTARNRDQVNVLKERILKQFWNLLNEENGITILKTGKQQYKFCVCKGNNPMIVKSLLKSRPWWNHAERTDENLNLLWTQWCSRKFVKALSMSTSKDIEVNPSDIKICNHLERHYNLSNKKEMFINMKEY